ncbi:MAG TPA: glycoside hydrolase family 2 TIM barrel-domain containing protein, partial [Gemmatales bacterium]|nr:glycoside hydrolase family 2 TIM barrel-domain containing protein [Gemmatales bacterium]
MSARIGLWILVGGLGLILRMQPPGPSAAKPTPGAKAEGRRLLSLDGEWRFRREGANEWKSVCVPGAWQHHEGMDFQGVGWFEKAINVSLAPGRRLVIHFDAVATHVTVFWNDVQIGEHLGGWTPFRFDVTDLVRQSEPGQQQRLRLRVDEKVGHNTQGFLPIIQPHFGGFWQSVRLLDLPSIFFEDHRAALLPQTNPRVLKLSVPLVDRAPEKTSPDFNQVVVQWRPVGTTDWKEQAFDLTFATQHRRSGRLVPVGQEPDPALLNENVLADDQLRLHLPIPELPTWSPERPDLLEVRVAIPGYDAFTTRTALRTIEAEGANLKLNGQPLIVRGVLNWGYYPPRLAPSPDPEVWRADLRLIKSWGFNLMKCCLWVPPKRLLEIADEEGVLIWMEYPTWHPKIDQKHREELLREYAEFFEFDRNHPAVILRSLTCETGHQADLVVIQELYDLGKRLVPGALIVDDSSWIEWIRVGDFYDDHPYGNNHTWLATLRRLQDYVARSKLGVKPLLLGEAIAADTWVNPSAIDELIRTRGSSDAASTPAGSLSGPTHG